MTPTYALKKGVRYRYYISVSAMQSRGGAATSVHRVAADTIEAIVVHALQEAQRPGDRMDDAFAKTRSDGLREDDRRVLEDLVRTTSDESSNSTNRFPPGSDAERRARELVRSDLERIVVHPGRIEIARRDGRDPDASTITLAIPWTKPSSTRRREILEPETSNGKTLPLAADERHRLLRATALARRWLDELIGGVVSDAAAIAARERKSERSVRMTLSLAFLDPALIEAAVENRLPRGYGVSRLVDLPSFFDDQWRALGLARPR